MPKVVGVRFKRACKVYYFDPAGLDVSDGDEVIVETSRGLGFGSVVLGPHEVNQGEVVSPLRRVVRTAADEDRDRVSENETQAEKARGVCQRKADQHGLEMQVIDADYAFDGSQLTFYFTADGRVDFRELVRDLARTFHTRIELRQVGVRDEAKMIGGMGPCGRPCCCTIFLDEFSPITIRMAKRQKLSLNPSKISGLCGRLMCCLQYEDEVYEEAEEVLPAPGTEVETADGEGRIVRCDSLEHKVYVMLGSGEVIGYSPGDVTIRAGSR
ncbi:MAG: stage 0 sporulation family protein [Bacillota bacterium]